MIVIKTEADQIDDTFQNTNSNRLVPKLRNLSINNSINTLHPNRTKSSIKQEHVR